MNIENANSKLIETINEAWEAQNNLEEGLRALDNVVMGYDYDVSFLKPELAMLYKNTEFQDYEKAKCAEASYEWMTNYSEIMWLLRVAHHFMHDAVDTLQKIQEAQM